ncbi:MAG: hypothetical protein HDR04_03265 [Lachnospiraceae bacterium]|nr:hypothetical protein [Lachnospiraceae bacterium]
MIQSRNSYHTIKRDEEENSTDRKRFRERTMGGRFLRKIFGTGLGVLCDKRSVAPAITVREAEHEKTC